MLIQMDRTLFGDNQFFGVNHMSEEKARTQSMRFQDIGAIIEVLDDAYAEGIRTFMCTTHERISEVCDHFRKHAGKYPGFKFFPCLPYAHKYANAAAELGVLGAVRSFLPQENALGASYRTLRRIFCWVSDSTMPSGCSTTMCVSATARNPASSP
jgi:hypothetical protein